MKKTKIARLVAVVLALVMMFGIFTGCSANAAMPAEFGGNTEKQTAATEQNSDKEAVSKQEETPKQETATKKTESSDELEGLKAEFEAMKDAYEALLAENDTLKAENEALREQVVPAVEVVDDVVYCDVDYFLERATVTFDDGTAALWAIEEGTEVVLDDIHAITERGNHREKAGLPLPINGGNVAVTLDGEKATSVALHTHDKEWALCYDEELETGYELRNAKRDGVEAEWLQITAVCVENKDAEFGYDFYIVINMECEPEVHTPVYTPQQPKPEEPKEEPKVEEPEVQPEEQPEPDRPIGGGNKPKPEEPENNPPIEDDPETPDEPIPGEPENNPPIEETPLPEGPQPPADMDPENSPPADMQDSSNRGPADFGVSDSYTSSAPIDSSAPADMGGSTSNSSSASRSDSGSSNRVNSAPASSGPADMA